MKTRQLVETANVKGASVMLKNLIHRTKPEVVGLGLIYGNAGLGKTRWAQAMAIRNGYYYMRLETSQRPRNFLMDLINVLSSQQSAVSRQWPGESYPVYSRATTKELFNEALEVLQGDENIVLFIDEIDYAFKNDRVLSTIRDLADLSLATFVLIGMQSAKEMLHRKNAHYFDRCNGFFQFRPLSPEDVKAILDGVCEVAVDDDIATFVHKKSSGTLRVLNKYIGALEQIGERMKKSTLAYAEIKDILKAVENG